MSTIFVAVTPSELYLLKQFVLLYCFTFELNKQVTLKDALLQAIYMKLKKKIR